MSDFVITARDLRSKGFCAKGQKAWFESRGMDFKEFLKNGILASELLATGDAMAERAVELLEADRG